MKEIRLFLARGSLTRLKPFVYEMRVSQDEAIRLLDQAPWTSMVGGTPYLTMIQGYDTGQYRTTLLWKKVSLEFMNNLKMINGRLKVRRESYDVSE